MEMLDLSKRYVYWFTEIAKIPHGSCNEKALSDRIVQFAKDNNLSWKQDDVWNVIIEKPATKGCENAEPIILQAHIDMVNEKTMDSCHDFEKDPLDLYVEDGWLYAKDTTLGADDGKGAAYMLALLEDETAVHPALECIFTVQEEIGLDGAKVLHKEDIHASRMISLDGGGEHVTATGSSAACRQVVTRRFQKEKNNDPVMTLIIRGLAGGHSASAINKERGNAILFAARILKEAEGAGVSLVYWEGGSKNNAIPSYTKVVFACKDKEAMQKHFAETVKHIKEEYPVSEPDFEAVLEDSSADEKMSAADTEAILDFLLVVPNGFMKRNLEIEGLTALSSNVGVMHTEGDAVSIDILSRGDRDSALDHVIDRISIAAKLCGMQYECGSRDPAWFYTPVSKMREIYAGVLAKHGEELVCQATHGGLECGVFKGLNPDMDIITFGAISEKEHAVGERLNLASYDKSYDLLKEILEAATKE